LTTRTQVTVKIELATKEKLVAEAIRRRPAGKKQVQIGRVIDWLAQHYRWGQPLGVRQIAWKIACHLSWQMTLFSGVTLGIIWQNFCANKTLCGFWRETRTS
jgi:hypothetical protein